MLTDAMALLSPLGVAEEFDDLCDSVTQYLPLSSLEQTAVLSGTSVYKISYIWTTSALGLDVSSTEHAE